MNAENMHPLCPQQYQIAAATTTTAAAEAAAPEFTYKDKEQLRELVPADVSPRQKPAAQDQEEHQAVLHDVDPVV